jgi:hypothetical protein
MKKNKKRKDDKEKDKDKEKKKKNYMNKMTNINDMKDKIETTNHNINEGNNYNYLKISGNNNIINYNINNTNEKNINKVFNYSFNNYRNNMISEYSNENSKFVEEKKNRSSSDLTSSSNSFVNMTPNYFAKNNINSVENTYLEEEIGNKDKNVRKDRRKGKKRMIEEISEKEIGEISEKDDLLSSNLLGFEKEEQKRNIDMDNQIQNMKEMENLPIKKLMETRENKRNKNKKKRKDNEEYETILLNGNDLMEVRPYNEYVKNRDEKSIYEEENEDGFLNDYDIFESGLLNNRQNEFLNYDFYNIQKKLRHYCNIRYEDDEIFNENKTFFNSFN